MNNVPEKPAESPGGLNQPYHTEHTRNVLINFMYQIELNFYISRELLTVNTGTSRHITKSRYFQLRRYLRMYDISDPRGTALEQPKSAEGDDAATVDEDGKKHCTRVVYGSTVTRHSSS